MKRINSGADLVYFKFFVYLMGVALILGCVFLSYMVYQRHLMDFPSQQSTPQGIDACNGGIMQLHIDGEVEISIQDGNRVFLLSKPNNTAQELVIIDYCENKVLSRVNFNNSETAQNNNEEINRVSEEEDNNNISAITIDSDNLSKAG